MESRRAVNHEDLITQAATASDLQGQTAVAGPELAESEIGAASKTSLHSGGRQLPVECKCSA
jgi:hypothetical protein